MVVSDRPCNVCISKFCMPAAVMVKGKFAAAVFRASFRRCATEDGTYVSSISQELIGRSYYLFARLAV